MNPELKVLIRLASYDSRLDAISKRLTEIPASLSEFNKQVQNREQELAQTQESIKALETKKRDAEQDIEDLQKKLEKYKKQIFEIKNNREYSTMVAEIDATQEQISAREEEFLLSLDAIEESSSRLSSMKEALAKSKSELVKLEKESEVEQSDLERESQILLKERGDFTNQLDPTTLSRYEKTRARNGGSAVALVEDSLCQGCFVNLPPQLVSRVRLAKELERCPNCARFLYAASSTDEDTAEVNGNRDSAE
jgi:predicted  nucleic acid-binding Zn-ribbon protein